MNLGQMVEDVRLAVNGRAPVAFYGRPGGALLGVEDIAQAIRSSAQCGERNEECSAQQI
jgi:2-oxoglutarate ferredoxin oxidoreductase subunit alpha